LDLEGTAILGAFLLSTLLSSVYRAVLTKARRGLARIGVPSSRLAGWNLHRVSGLPPRSVAT
jgi:hypothetical protein